MPKTPVKKNKSVYGNIKNNEIYSPISNTLRFEEDTNNKMVIRVEKGAAHRFHTEYEILSKLGEGYFGEAFMVR